MLVNAMRFELFVFFIVISGILCRRHHHYHYHRANLTNYQTADGNTSQNYSRNISQKLTAIDVQSGSEIETFTPYTKHTTGRHVCTSKKTVSHPVKTVQTFCKPTYKKYMQRCNKDQLCTGVKLVYETAYRDVYSTKNTQQIDYICCPGWTQINHNSHGCNKPLCTTPCQNGGSCVKPETCSCPKGYKGKYCETDVDECREIKPCDQICRNTPGSFKCDCMEFFILESDGQTCRREGEDGPGIETRDLEYELLHKRLFKLESMMNDMADHTIPKDNIEIINNKIESLTEELKILKSRIYEIENNHRDIRVMKNKISALEHKATKMDEITKRYETGVKSPSYSNRIYN